MQGKLSKIQPIRSGRLGLGEASKGTSCPLLAEDMSAVEQQK